MIAPLKDNPTSLEQRAFILAYIRLHGRITTLEARKHGVMSPASRILELKQQGYNIVGNWIKETDGAGVLHRVRVYTLDSGKHE